MHLICYRKYGFLLQQCLHLILLQAMNNTQYAPPPPQKKKKKKKNK